MFWTCWVLGVRGTYKRSPVNNWTCIYESGIQGKQILAKNINLGISLLMVNGDHITKLCEAGEDVCLVNRF